MAVQPGLGLTLPVQDGPTGYFDVAYDVVTQVKSNITNLLLTKKGERIMNPTFGCGIHSLVFDQITDDILANARGAIEESIQTWMPFVSVSDVQLQKKEDTNQVYLTITFSIKAGVNLTDVLTLVI